MSSGPGERLETLGEGFSWRRDRLEWPLTTDVGDGLDGVVAAETRVCWLDPTSGILLYRGVPVEALIAAPDFEATVGLLIGATGDEVDEVRRGLRASRQLPTAVLELIADQPRSTHPTRLLRAAVSALGCHEMTAADDLAGGEHWREPRIVGQVVALVAAVAAHRRGSAAPPPPSPATSLAAGLVAVLGGGQPTAAAVRALDLLWVLYAAHGMDAPTFTSMVVASCHADPYSNVVAGLSAMRGRRQGGVGEAVLDQVLPLAGPDQARRWVAATVAAGGRVAGFGHRHYRMPDPRVAPLRKEVALLARSLGREELFVVARAVEDAATRALAGRGVHVNINFYAALLFHLLGADAALVPCLFAAGRMAGLVALVRESMGSIRLHRPRLAYVGEPPRPLPSRWAR